MLTSSIRTHNVQFCDTFPLIFLQRRLRSVLQYQRTTTTEKKKNIQKGTGEDSYVISSVAATEAGSRKSPVNMAANWPHIFAKNDFLFCFVVVGLFISKQRPNDRSSPSLRNKLLLIFTGRSVSASHAESLRSAQKIKI